MSEPYIKVRVTAEEKRAIFGRLGNEGGKAQALLRSWLLEWLQEEREATPPLRDTGAPSGRQPDGRVPKEHREAHELLEIVLSEGTDEQIGWIVGNLRTFKNEIRLRAQVEDLLARTERKASDGRPRKRAG